MDVNGALRNEAVYGRDRFHFDLEIERDEFLCLTGRAHPRAEGRGMRRGFVMSMVSSMSHRLGIHGPA